MTQQLQQMSQAPSQSASGLALMLLMLGASPNDAAAARSPRQSSAAVSKSFWALGIGILSFASAGAVVCLQSLA